jgi:hypothetical protein
MGKLAELMKRPDEVWPLLVMALAAQRAKQLPRDPSLAFCYSMLNRVSRRCAAADASPGPGARMLAPPPSRSSCPPCGVSLGRPVRPQQLPSAQLCGRDPAAARGVARRGVRVLPGAARAGHRGGRHGAAGRHQAAPAPRLPRAHLRQARRRSGSSRGGPGRTAVCQAAPPGTAFSGAESRPAAHRTFTVECGYGPYVDLMRQYPLVTDLFLRLGTPYQKARRPAARALAGCIGRPRRLAAHESSRGGSTRSCAGLCLRGWARARRARGWAGSPARRR